MSYIAEYVDSHVFSVTFEFSISDAQYLYAPHNINLLTKDNLVLTMCMYIT